MAQENALTRDDVTHANVVYHEKLAPTYDDRIELYHPRVLAYNRRILETYVLSRVPDLRKARVLDLGCGTGYLEQFLVDRCSSVTAVDVSGGMLAVARRKHPAVSFVEQDVYAFPIERAAYDVILENALLHHLKEYEDVLDRMAEGCKPGGILFLGYEPNEVAFRMFAPLRALYRALFVERRVGDVNAVLTSDEYEKLAEYHQFYGYGLNPRRLRRRLVAQGFRNVRILYPTISFLAQLHDRTRLPLADLIPFLRLGPLTPNFHLVAEKVPA